MPKEYLIKVGDTFGRLTVVGSMTLPNGRRRWICLCRCGKKVVRRTSILVRNPMSSCSKRCRENVINVGDIFGKLEVIEKVEGGDRQCWVCRCQCGKQLILPTYRVLRTNACSRWCGSRIKPLDTQGQELVCHWLPWAMRFSGRWKKKWPRWSDEIEGAALYGLVCAACGYRPEKGPFDNYARLQIKTWIKDLVTRFIFKNGKERERIGFREEEIRQ